MSINKLRTVSLAVVLFAFCCAKPLLGQIPPALYGRRDTQSSSLQRSGLSNVPSAAQPTISGALGRELAIYRAKARDGRILIENPPNQLTAAFNSDGVRVQSGTADCMLSLLGYGYGQFIRETHRTDPIANSNRVEFNRGDLTEWYVNGPVGLEQGFTLKTRPGRFDGHNTLKLALRISGNLIATATNGDNGLILSNENGTKVLQYTGLKAYDARGRELPASLRMRESTVYLAVDDRGARYPIVIDPWVQLAKFTASDGTSSDQFGWSVATSGTTVVVGMYTCCAGSAAYIFVKPTTGWATSSHFAAKLTSSDDGGADWFGYSVGISGNTVVVGAPLNNLWQGAVYLYVKPQSGWKSMTQTAKLTASDGVANDMLGYSVAINGNSVISGAVRASIGMRAYQGAAYVFTRPLTGWKNVTQTAKLTTSDFVIGNFGHAVAINSSTAVVGAYEAANGGAVYVYSMLSTGWKDMTEQTARLTSSYATNALGWSVSISGTTIAAGDFGETIGGNSGQGAAYIFVKPLTGWTDMTETARLTASDGAAGDALGISVSLSGNYLVAGALGAKIGSNAIQGAAYVFAKPSTGWRTTSTFNAKLKAADGAANDRFGNSVSISGNTIVAGAPQAAVGLNANQGAAYLFQDDFSVWAAPALIKVLFGTPTSASYKVSVRPLGGFSGAVALKCSITSKLGTCSIPSSVDLAGITVSVTVKVNTLATAPVGAYTISIVASAVELSDTATAQLNVVP